MVLRRWNQSGLVTAHSRAQVGYRRKPRPRGGKPSVVADNVLDREFTAGEPPRVWVADMTYIRTHEGWLFLALVIDLFSRQLVGWAMHNTQHTDVVLQALLSAVWRRKPEPGLLLHSDQGNQYTRAGWQAFLNAHGIVCSMCRKGNCHDKAVTESFFQMLKREWVRRHTYPTHGAPRADVFDYIEMFYNPKRRQGSIERVSPVEFEERHAQRGF
jgi:putative transposase